MFVYGNYFFFFFFFFQAEDGIRDLTVTGVQTCALPISLLQTGAEELEAIGAGMYAAAARRWRAELLPPEEQPAQRAAADAWFAQRGVKNPARFRSEERRVGKECRSRWWPKQEKKRRGDE